MSKYTLKHQCIYYFNLQIIYIKYPVIYHKIEWKFVVDNCFEITRWKLIKLCIWTLQGSQIIVEFN